MATTTEAQAPAATSPSPHGVRGIVAAVCGTRTAALPADLALLVGRLILAWKVVILVGNRDGS